MIIKLAVNKIAKDRFGVFTNINLALFALCYFKPATNYINYINYINYKIIKGIILVLEEWHNAKIYHY